MLREAELRGPFVGVRRLRPGWARLRIGRHATNDVVIARDTVSRFHAEIDWPEGQALPRLRDLASSNGTRVDGLFLARDERRPLASGALLDVGGAALRLTLAGDPCGPAGIDTERLLSSSSDLLVPVETTSPVPIT